MLYPIELQYSKSHEWVKVEDGVTVVGISDFAQNALGDVVFVNLPAEGDSVTAGDAFGDVESVKAVSDLVSPVSGTVCAVNEDLLDAPENSGFATLGKCVLARGRYMKNGLVELA